MRNYLSQYQIKIEMRYAGKLVPMPLLCISLLLMLATNLFAQHNQVNKKDTAHNIVENPLFEEPVFVKLSPNLYKTIYTQGNLPLRVTNERYSDSSYSRVGTSIEYHENGTPRCVIFYNNNQRQDSKAYFDTLGSIVSYTINNDGLSAHSKTFDYYKNGILASYATFDSLNHQDTIVRFYPNGLKEEIMYFPFGINDYYFGRLLFKALSNGYDTIVKSGYGEIVETNSLGDTIMLIDVKDGIRYWRKYVNTRGETTIQDGNGYFRMETAQNLMVDYSCNQGIFSDSIKNIEFFGEGNCMRTEYLVNPSSSIIGYYNTYYCNGNLKSSIPYEN